jgi:hypothetical protein
MLPVSRLWAGLSRRSTRESDGVFSARGRQVGWCVVVAVAGRTAPRVEGQCWGVVLQSTGRPNQSLHLTRAFGAPGIAAFLHWLGSVV